MARAPPVPVPVAWAMSVSVAGSGVALGAGQAAERQRGVPAEPTRWALWAPMEVPPVAVAPVVS